MTEEQQNRCVGHARDGSKCSGDAYEQFSLGIYAGRWCDKHWKTSGYRTEGPEGFDPMDAGETYEPDDWGDGGSW